MHIDDYFAKLSLNIFIPEKPDFFLTVESES